MEDNLRQAWTQSKLGSVAQPITQEELREQIKAKSHGTLEVLARKVRMKMLIAGSTAMILMAFIPFVFPVASQVLLTILWIAYLAGTILLYREWTVLRSSIDMSVDLLQGLCAYVSRIRKVIWYEETVLLCLYPVSAAGGFLFGWQLADPDMVVMGEPSHWAFLLPFVAITTPLGHLLARKLNRRSFGKYLDRLEKDIEELRES